jgi:predicted nucleic acid-binding protein
VGPQRPLIDTCVIASAAAGDETCRRLLEILKERKAQLMIAMVVYAELARGIEYGGKARIPNGVLSVAFDTDAADALARHFPTKTMKAMGSASERQFWNFDALILASAIAAGADAVITNNVGDFEALIRQADYDDEITLEVIPPFEIVRDYDETMARRKSQRDMFTPDDE